MFFNICFSDTGEYINDVLKIMSLCVMFCLLCKPITKIADDLIGIFKVILVSAKTGHPWNCRFLIRTIPLNAFRLIPKGFL